jgi:DNA-binding NtrC family response regulator
LAHHFLRRCDQLGSNVEAIAPAATDILLARDWPGNVDELRDVVERAVKLANTEAVEAASVAALEGRS